MINDFFKKGFSSIFLKVFGIVFGVLANIILARKMGVEGYGVYSYAIAWASMLSIPCMMGLPTLIVRETARYEKEQRWAYVKGLWHWSNKVVFIFSISILSLAFLVFFFKRPIFFEEHPFSLIFALLIVPISSLAAVRGGILRGLRKVISSQLPEDLIRPIFFLLFVLLFIFFNEITPTIGVVFYVLSCLIALIIGFFLLQKENYKKISSTDIAFEKSLWIKSIIPLSLLSGLSIFSSKLDILMLGVYASAAEVGVYRVALQGAEICALGIMAANLITMPYMARAAHSKDFSALAEIAKKNSRLASLVSGLFFLIIILFGERLMLLIFGKEYLGAYLSLIILAFSQLLHAALGAGGNLLNMAGYEKGTLVVLSLTLCLNMICNLFFIPMWGIEGAAFSSLIAVVFRKITIWIIVYRKFGIDTSFLGFKSMRLINK